MIKVQLKSRENNIEAFIPECWSEITTAQFISYFKNNNEINDLKLLSLLSNIDEDVLGRCKTKDVLWLIVNLKNIFTQENLEREASEALTTFTHNGNEYKLCKDLGSETIGELYDLIKVQQWIDGGASEHLTLMLAMLYRPEGELYDFITCQSRAKEFETLPITIAWKARNFFFLLTQLSERIKSTQEYLQNNQTPQPQEQG